MRNSLIVVLLALLPVAAFAQGSLYEGVAQTATGQALAGVSVNLCTGSVPNAQPCASPATTYTDITLGTPCATSFSTIGFTSGAGCTNPGITDGLGRYTFYGAAGTYQRQIYGSVVAGPLIAQVILPASGTGVAGGSTGYIQSRSSAGSFAGHAILFADDFTGATADVKIANAIAALPGGTGTVYAPFASASQTISATVTVGQPNQPVTLILGPASYNCNAGASNCFLIAGSGSKLVGQKPINTILTCSNTFTGDLVHAENGVALSSIEIASFREDLTNCPNSIGWNLLSIRDNSRVYDLTALNFLGTIMQVTLSSNVGGQIAEGVVVRDSYFTTGSGTLTADSVIFQGNQMEWDNNKVICTGTNAGFRGMVVSPDAAGTSSPDGRNNNIRASSFAGYSTGLIVESLGGNLALGNLVEGNTFENDTTGYTISGSAGKLATDNFGIANYFENVTTEVRLDWANHNTVLEVTQGGAGNITATANATNNTILSNGNLTDITNGSASNGCWVNTAGAWQICAGNLIQALVFQTANASPSTSGILRLADGDAIGWRNHAGGSNVLLSKDASDNLIWPNGVGIGGGSILNFYKTGSDAPGAITVNAGTCTNRSVAITGTTASSTISVAAGYALEANLGIGPGQAAANSASYRICNPTGGNITLGAGSTFNVTVIGQ